jgi:uncharacterized peroxidase-related enzyme
MAFIDIVGPDEAEPGTELAAFYDEVAGQRGNVANVHQLASQHPALGETHLDLYMAIMYDRDAGLDRRRRELVATAVSSANGCEYCVTHHREALEAYEDDELAEAVARDPEGAELGAADRALVDYALALTREPDAVDEARVDALREHGFDDEDVLNAGAVASYFNFVNRLVLGLGADLEDEDERAYDY